MRVRGLEWGRAAAAGVARVLPRCRQRRRPRLAAPTRSTPPRHAAGAPCARTLWFLHAARPVWPLNDGSHDLSTSATGV
jgi:hypothetical protein